MRTEMSKAEAITRIDRFLAYLEEIYTPQCDCEEALIRKDDITAFVIARDALKEQRPHGEWIHGGYFLITNIDKLVRLDYFRTSTNDFDNYSAIAWMPLPTPYMEEGE